MTFLTDFGLSDEYVAVCKAVIRGVAAEVEIFDISHLIPPFGVRQGALVLAAAAPYFPGAVHLAVVDPGVGSARRAVVLGTEDGALLVGPDNGLLLAAAARLGGVRSARQITNPALGLPEPSATFHGRDVFAPAAAHLALGTPMEEFGPPLDPALLVPLPAAAVQDLGRHLRGEILQTDRFGNLQTSFGARDLRSLGLDYGARVKVELAGRWEVAAYRESYSFGTVGELQLVEDSHAQIAVCVNRGNAAERFEGVASGSPVWLEKPGSEPGRPA